MALQRSFAGALAMLVVAGCATVATSPPTPASATPTSFDAAGRLSARRGNEGAAVHFTWKHAPDTDRLDIATPLGQVVARLTGDADGVRVVRPNEPSKSFANWNDLTRDVLGVPIPVSGLASWIVGAPAGGAGFDFERDGQGRPLVLRQQGWEIVYAYGDDAASARPARLVMRYPGSEPIEVRIVVDRFEAGV